MADYYFKQAGSDVAAGTSDGTAWKTVQKFEDEVDAGNFNAGDVCHFNCGDTWTANTGGERTGSAPHMAIFPTGSGASSGTKGNPIIVTHYGTGALPLFDMDGLNGWVFGRTGNSTAWGGHYFHFENLAFTNAGGQQGIYGELASGWSSHHCYYYDLRANPTNFGGFQMKDDSEDAYCEWSVFKDIGGECTYAGTGVYPDNTKFFDVYFNTMLRSEGEAVDIKNTIRWSRFVGNWVAQCASYLSRVGNAQVLIDSTGGLILRNYVGPQGTYTTGGINVGRRTVQSGKTGTKIFVVGNYVENQTHSNSGILVGGVNNYAYRNTLANNTVGMRIESRSGGPTHVAHLIKDHIFVNNTTDVNKVTADTVTIDNNAYDGSDSGLETTSYENQNFGFESDTRKNLTASSPAISIGTGDDPYQVDGNISVGWLQRRKNRVDWEYFYDSFEDNNTNRWDNQTGTTSELATSAASKRYGNFGLEYTANTTDDKYLTKNNLGDLIAVRISFDINMDNFLYPTSSYAILCRVLNSSSSVGFYLQIGDDSGADIGIRQNTFDDASAVDTGAHFDFVAGWNKVEWYILSSSDSAFSDGFSELWVNGSFHDELTGKNNDTKTIDTIDLGLLTGVDSGLSGEFYIDNFQVDDLRPGLFQYSPLYYANTMHNFLFDEVNNLGENRGNNKDLAITGTPSLSGIPFQWWNCGAVRMETTDYFTLSNTSDIPTALGQTYFIRCKLDNSGVLVPILGWGDNSSDRAIRFYIDTDDRIAVKLSVNGTSWDVETKSDIPLYNEVWYTLALTISSGGVVQIYVNGQATIDSPATLSGALNSPISAMVVGRDYVGSTSTFAGWFSELSICPTGYDANQVYSHLLYGIENIPDSTIIDDQNVASFVTTGTWTEYIDSTAEHYGDSHWYAEPGSNTATWTFTVSQLGTFQVYASWVDGANRDTIDYTVTHDGGTTVVSANQVSDGGKWNLLGAFQFTSGGSVSIDATTLGASKHMIADGVQLRQQSTGSSSGGGLLIKLLMRE